MIPLNACLHQNVFQESQEIGVRLIISLGSELVGTRLFGRVHLVILWSGSLGEAEAKRIENAHRPAFHLYPTHSTHCSGRRANTFFSCC